MSKIDFVSKLKTTRLVFWWIMRIIMLTIPLFPYHTKHENMFLQLVVSYIILFTWEFLQIIPAKDSFLRKTPPYLQDFLIVLIFVTTYLGAYFNFYYTIWWWDSLIHFLSGILCVYVGYEVVFSVEQRDHKVTPKSLAIFCAFAMPFLFGTFWEIFEFIFDQITGSDCQHWNYANNDGMYQLFNPTPGRFPIMDTMTDIICNTLGAITGTIILVFNPYHHKSVANNSKGNKEEIISQEAFSERVEVKHVSGKKK